MSTEPTTPPPPPPTPASPPPVPPAPTTTSTPSGTDGNTPNPAQAELDRVASKAATEAERRALNKVAEQLGMTVDEAAAAIEAQKAADKAAMSDAERLKVEAEERIAEAEALASSAAAAQVKADLRSALMTPGPNGEPPADPAMIDVILDMGAVTGLASGDGETAIADAVAHARAVAPTLFSGQSATPAAPHITPPPPQRRGGQNGQTVASSKSDAETAYERWQQRNQPTQI